MKSYSKIVLLVVFALFFTLTACTLKASKPPAASPTPNGGEAPFPYTTAGAGDVGTFGTQTAVAQTPATTQEVLVATETKSVPQPGQEAVTPQPTAAVGSGGDSGGGQAVPVNTPVINRPANWTLQKGEWPICIARRYNLDLNTFFASNGLNMNSKPAAGTNLRIPTSGSWSANYGARSLKAHPTTYTVVAGDTIYTIACRYGDVDPESILTVNNIKAGDVKAGISLKIP
jgi:LysM repeat protein